MRFMIIVKANKESEAGAMPTDEMIGTMAKFNEELMKAGVLLELSGLEPSSKGVRVQYSGKKRSVIDGPFAETKELIAGFWLIQAKSQDEAIEWAKRAPFEGGEVEVRRLFDMEDFAPGEGVERAKQLGRELERQKAAA